MNLKKINYPIIIGTVILILILLISMYPENFSTADPYGKQRLEYSTDSGKSTILIPPVPPCKEYPWGTDHLGRDMKSLIIYGCKTTMAMALIIALGRLLIALPIAILAAYKNKAAGWFIKQFNVIFSAFPLIILVLVLTKVSFFSDLFTDPKAVTAVILIFLGWSKLAHLLKKEVEEVLQQDFIEGEVAIGKNKWEIALQNIIPHIIPSVIIQFFLEIAMVLLIMAQLGIIGLLLSGGYYSEDGALRVPYEFDWASLLVFSNFLYGSDKMWIVLYPSLAFGISIIGFNLFGEGLRIEFEKRNSMIITLIRRIPSFLSPVRLVYEIRHFAGNRKKVYQKVAFYLAVILIIFFPQPGSVCQFDAAAAFGSIKELKSQKYQGSIDGSRNYVQIADYLAGQMKKVGLQPFDGSYLHDIKIEEKYKQLKSSDISAIGSDSSKLDFKLGYDYILNNYFFVNNTFDIVVCTVKDVEKLSPEKIKELHEKVIIMDTRKFKDTDYRVLYSAIFDNIRPKVYITIGNWNSGSARERAINQYKGINETILVSASTEMGDKLLKLGNNSKLAVNITSATYPYDHGINVLGYIPGSDEKLKNEYIILGSHIDATLDDINLVDSGEMKYSATALQLQLAQKIAQSGIKPKRTIIFAFWDGPLGYSRGSAQFADQYINRLGKKAIYFDLRSFASIRADKLIMDTSRTIPKNKVAQDYIKALKKYARRNDINLTYGTVYSPLAEDFRGNNREAIALENNVVKSHYGRYYDDINFIDQEKLDKIGQTLLDTIIEISK